jgi:preprotein translocase subunit SecB
MTDQANAQSSGDGPQLALLRVYLKDVSFETPNSPAVFMQESNQNVELQLNTAVNQLDENTYEVILRITVTAMQEGKTAFLAEVQQAGLFALKGFDDAQKGAMLAAYCPNTLFPFARQAIADLVMKGGFPQLLLAPINFEALHAQSAARARDQQAAAPTEQVIQ